MANTQTISINFPGGIISPGYLHDVMELAVSSKISHAKFGHRQQMHLSVPVKQFRVFQQACSEKGILYNTGDDSSPNIVSSYPAEGVFISDSWLSEGVYKDIFDLFDYAPRLKVNICEADQTFVPFFSGNINWIASSHQHFWYLYIRFPKTNTLFLVPELIYTNDIVYVTKAIEDVIMGQLSQYYRNVEADGNVLYQLVKEKVHPISKPVEKELALPEFRLPYYEGFNKHGNHYWLGIYRRDEEFPVSFLKDLALVCLQTKVGELYSTPWKSLVIKGIAPADRIIWDQLLGKHRINVRHAANELNWQIEDNNEDGLIIKRHVIRYFDKEDVRTYGLCFTVKTKSKSGIFGSVIIRKQDKANRNRLKSLERFEILYTADFNPNSSEYILFRDNVEKEHLGVYLVSLCKMYYESRSAISELPRVSTGVHVAEPEPSAEVYQCSHCLSTYDRQFGDPENNIAAGTRFEDLTEEYRCPLCESGKDAFELADTIIMKMGSEIN